MRYRMLQRIEGCRNLGVFFDVSKDRAFICGARWGGRDRHARSVSATVHACPMHRAALGLVREGAFHNELVGGQSELAHPIRSGRSEFCVRFLPSPDDHGLMVVLPRTRLLRACYRVTICRESDGQGLTKGQLLTEFGGEQVIFAVVKPAVSFKRKIVVPDSGLASHLASAASRSYGPDQHVLDVGGQCRYQPTVIASRRIPGDR